MKKVFMFISFLFLAAMVSSTTASAQLFIPQKSTNLADFNVCQENHNRLLDTMIQNSERQIARLLNGIAIEEDANDSSPLLITAYNDFLIELVMKRLFYLQLKKQLNHQKLGEFYAKRENHEKDIFDPTKVVIGLELEYSKTIKLVDQKYRLRITDQRMNKLNSYLLSTALTHFAVERGLRVVSTVGSRLFLGFVSIRGGKIVLQSVAAGLTRSAFQSAGVGLLINLAVLPLKGSRLPMEDVWLNILKEYPELIIVPDMMKKAGMNDHPWSAHCYALARRTKPMEKTAKNVFKADENEFIQRIILINESIEGENEETEIKENNFYLNRYHTQDNTRVVIPRYVEKLAPLWAYQLKF